MNGRVWERRSIPGHLFEITENGNPVFRLRGGMMPVLEDARLIAAAPEMFEALQRAVVKLSAYVGICKDDKELTETILPMVRAAIAKATR